MDLKKSVPKSFLPVIHSKEALLMKDKKNYLI